MKPGPERIMVENLLALAQAYASANGWSLATVSKRIHGNQAFLADFLEGNVSTSIKTYFQMVDKLRAEWPKGTAWPATREVPRLARTPGKTAAAKRDATGRFLGKKVYGEARR